MPEFYEEITIYRCHACSEDYDYPESAEACCTGLCEHCGERFSYEELSTDRDGWGVLSCDHCYEDENDEGEYASPSVLECAECGSRHTTPDTLRFDPLTERRLCLRHPHAVSLPWVA